MSVKGINSESYKIWDPQERSNEYLKKKGTPESQGNISQFSSTLVSLNPSVQMNSLNKISDVKKTSKPLKIEGVEKNFFEDAWDWIKGKWNSFLEYVGLRNPYEPKERDRTTRTRILERSSPNEIDEEFKYIDISTMDPMKAFIAILVQQGILRQEQAFIVSQKILLEQEDLKDSHASKMEIQAELAVIDKQSNILEKIKVVLTGGQIAGFVASSAGVVAGAATIATGGMAAGPIAVVTLVFNIATSAAKAAHTWFSGHVKEKMDALQVKYTRREADSDRIQFQLKLDLKDIKKIFSVLAAHAEIGKALIDAQAQAVKK